MDDDFIVSREHVTVHVGQRGRYGWSCIVIEQSMVIDSTIGRNGMPNALGQTLDSVHGKEWNAHIARLGQAGFDRLGVPGHRTVQSWTGCVACSSGQTGIRGARGVREG